MLVSIRALSGDTFYAMLLLGIIFTTHSQKKSRRYGPNKQIWGCKNHGNLLRTLFSHVFCNESPYAESVILHFSKRSVEEVLRPRCNTNSKKTTFFKKRTFFLCFLRLVGICIAPRTQGSIWSPFGRRFFCTGACINSFAKIFGICPIDQRRYSCFLGSLRQSVFSGSIQNHALMKINVFARKGCKS